MTNTTSTNQARETRKPPVAKLRIGLVNAMIWERTTDKGTFHSVSFERRYRNGKGEWQSTQSFDSAGLLTLAKLADQAHSELTRLASSKAEI